ncbi:hydantoinase B/oxoprolinase family protein [Yangia mangrovi]|uniref:Hydantoinase B/oxoprolinase family protein n=2 Tax=Alloyangia mangrovi TaxID=1779329 RepID=A0ABT2KK95_9RHOB|nr:hydantoinase B/oxoprolinase family protein [Alloyangia mangrovi]MCT4370780.1 hydantoinase B/oxoprolinase family protein [Alloyangia mangrovi]
MDPVRTAVMGNRFSAIVEEASAIVHRTAHTTFVKLIQDYQCALATPEGEIFAYPTQSGVTVFVGMPLHTTLDRIGRENFEEGDIYIMNDPFYTDGLVTHMMDVTMLYPVFRDGELIAFGWSFVHASDIGGAVPGSISPEFKEFYQEGLRVRPIKLFRRGELNHDARNIFLDNSRIPDEMWGDFTAMISGMRSMDRRLNELCDRYGTNTVKQGMQDVIAFGEEKSRDIIRELPDGEFTFSDYVEAIEGDQHIHLCTTMRIKGDELELDFTGTDPQVAAAYNFIIGDRTHPYVTQALTYYLLTKDPNMPMNAGLLRPITTVAPRGTVVNAEPPAAMGSRVAAGTRLYDTLLGCLDQALNGGLMGAGAGMVGIIVCTARDRITGRRRVSTLNPIMGGGGGRNGVDGIDGADGRSGALRNIPTEIIEVETMIHMRSCTLVPDTQSPGMHRSGSSLLLEMENTDQEATFTVRGMDRFRFRPWGTRGGNPGRPCEVILNPGTEDERSIGKIKVLIMKKGEVLRIISPAGGGFGDPLERDPARVAADLRAEMLSPERARADYGVVLDTEGAVDMDATRALRDERRAAAAAPQGHFNFGPEREAYNAIWPQGMRALLATEVLKVPKSARRNVMDAAYASLGARGCAVDEAAIHAALDAACAAHDVPRARAA